MINFFKQKSKSSNVIIRIENNELLINENTVALPSDWNIFKQYFGIPSVVKRNKVYWKDLGISTNLKDNGFINHLSFHIDYNPMETQSKRKQKPFFEGKIIVDGIELNKKGFDNLTKHRYEVNHFTYVEKKTLLNQYFL